MGNRKGRQVRVRTSNREAEVKPRGPGAKADLPIAKRRTERQFLGFTFTGGRSPNRRKIAPESLKRFRACVRRLTTYLRGWRGYFGYCETPSVLRDLDSWISHRAQPSLFRRPGPSAFRPLLL